MQKGFHLRKIRKDGTILFRRRRWKTRGDVDHIIGRSLIFGDYPSEPDLLSLWGTERFGKCDPESPEGCSAWTEVCKIMGVKSKDDPFTRGSGIHCSIMNEENGKFVAYNSRGIEWWKPVDNNQPIDERSK